MLVERPVVPVAVLAAQFVGVLAERLVGVLAAQPVVPAVVLVAQPVVPVVPVARVSSLSAFLKGFACPSSRDECGENNRAPHGDPLALLRESTRKRVFFVDT